MTPGLLKKIGQLIYDGATVVGTPPSAAPGLSGYPQADRRVKELAASIWGPAEPGDQLTARPYGQGNIISGAVLEKQPDHLYPHYELTAGILAKMGVPTDFEANAPLRYTHRTSARWDIYFVSNTTGKRLTTLAKFRTVKGRPELWDAITGEIRSLPDFSIKEGQTSLPLRFEAYQSFFIVFDRGGTTTAKASGNKLNFFDDQRIATLSGPWRVSFDPKWGGPAHLRFDSLASWTTNADSGIKYYSGTAVYRKDFDLPANADGTRGLLLDLGNVKNMARIKLNGKDLGVVWTAPWQVDISGAVVPGHNHLEIEVVNLWVNRLIGDAALPFDGPKDGRWPDWLLKGLPRPGHRYTFTVYQPYEKDSPLLESGLLGPVSIVRRSPDARSIR